MANTKYTIIGMSGSGKTCYIAGAYKAMLSDKVKGFELQAGGDYTIKTLNAQLRKLRETGDDRYPAKTQDDIKDIRSLQFNLLYERKSVITFDLIDYAGGAIANKGLVFLELRKSIAESTVLYIFVDGELFCNKDKNERKENFFMAVQWI